VTAQQLGEKLLSLSPEEREAKIHLRIYDVEDELILDEEIKEEIHIDGGVGFDHRIFIVGVV
jgi:hypothetical protein